MPATEKTWRDLRLMHFVFGLSSLAMLVTTIWMLAADHNRQWKKYQSQREQIDNWQTAARIAEEKTQSFEKERTRLQEQLNRQQLTPPPKELIDRFTLDALYDKFLAKNDGKPPTGNSIVPEYEALAALPPAEIAEENNLQRVKALLAELEKQVSDTTGVRTAYNELVKLAPAESPPVVSRTPSPAPAGGAESAAAQGSPPAAAQPSAAPEPDPKNAAAIEAARKKLLRQMQAVVDGIKYVESTTGDDRKIQRSLYDAARSELDIAVRDGAPEAQRRMFQGRVDKIRDRINVLTLRYEQAVRQRMRLEELLKTATRSEDLAAKNLADYDARVKKLEETLYEQTNWLNRGIHYVQELPILDGFSPRLKIEQIWLPGLTLNNNFRDVARFDRCITCHQQIDKAAAGSASEPAFPLQSRTPLIVQLPTPDTRPEVTRAAGDAELTDQQFHDATRQIYGLRIAAAGMLNPNDVTLEVVWPQTPAAKAGLERGDVIVAIRDGAADVKINSRKQALEYLVTQVKWGQPIVLSVRRGLPHPFAGHPRLDLFLGSMSPHKMQTFGCTICHQGQGSATSFEYASHTPDSLTQEAEWEKEYGYFHNHHWIYPMYPSRFVESSCLKCHHSVVDLQPTPRFPDPPAPKVVSGYKLVTQMGCFGCHEITGIDGPKSIGPDVRAEPMYYAAAAALTIDVPPLVPGFEKLLAEAVKEERPTLERLLKAKAELADLNTRAAENRSLAAKAATAAADLAKKKDAAKADVDRAAAELKRLQAVTTADAAAIEAKQKEVDVAVAANKPFADTVAAFQQSLADLKAITGLAHTVANHPQDTPARLRLLEYLTTDSARSEAPQKLLADPVLPPEMFKLAQEISARPNDMELRRDLVARLKQAQVSGAPPLKKESLDLTDMLSAPSILSPSAQKLADQVKTVEGPGTFRKVGPSLRHVKTKLGEGTLNRWIYNPRSIRDSTKMPRFFGIHAGLTADARRTAAMYEPIEARGMAQYLMDHSVALEYLPAPANVPQLGDDATPEEKKQSSMQGKLFFQTRGCLACHKQADTPQAESTFAPDLTGLGTKLKTADGKKWLVSWLRDPKRYHLRTAMPNTFLEPVKVPVLNDEGKPQLDENNKPRLQLRDPAADIAQYLLGADWVPAEDPFTTFAGGEDASLPEEAPLAGGDQHASLLDLLKKWLPNEKPERLAEYARGVVPAELANGANSFPSYAKWLTKKVDEKEKAARIRQLALDTLVEEYLLSVFPVERSRRYLESGIPEDVKSSLKGAEVELVGEFAKMQPDEVNRMKLNYVGRRAISKFGCTGCHDVPGFESARPIGTGLADWGRKETSKLAFEHILEFLPVEQAQRAEARRKKEAQRNGHANGAATVEHATDERAADGPAAGGHDAEHVHLDPEKWGADGFFIEALKHQQREGFLWQKLRQPRSYDFEKTHNKSYNEWLRMPKFKLTPAEREQIMTFVLGLVSEPPAAPYVHNPGPRRAAEIRGEKALATFNCQACHVLNTGEWKIAFAPGLVSPGDDSSLPPYLRHHITPEQRRASQEIDRRGLLSATVRGMYRLTEEGLPEITEVTPEQPGVAPFQQYRVGFWQPAVVSGGVAYPGDPLPSLSAALTPENPLITRHYPAVGGDFARLLLPIAVEHFATDKKGEAAWSWGPPPLVGQGRKTQDKWLHDFLLDPTIIRPAVLLRMPKFNMSSDEAETLVQFFAARDNANYPHHYGGTDLTQRVAAADARYAEENSGRSRMGDAEKVVLSKAGCIKCHLVGNYVPEEQAVLARGPNLANVYRRLKPDYVHRWIGKPNLILPYTEMPVNFPYNPGDSAKDGFWDENPVTKEKFKPLHGGSLEQAQAVSDLLSTWDRYIEGQTSIKKKVQAAGAPAPPASEGR